MSFSFGLSLPVGKTEMVTMNSAPLQICSIEMVHRKSNKNIISIITKVFYST